MQFEKPVFQGEVVRLKCEGQGKMGDGLFKKDGFAIFVPGAKAGQEYNIKITRVNATVAFGEIVG